MIVLNVMYKNKLYNGVALHRISVQENRQVAVVVASYAFGDPVLDWRLMRHTLTYLEREGIEVHRGASCDQFVIDVPGFRYTDDDQLDRIGE